MLRLLTLLCGLLWLPCAAVATPQPLRAALLDVPPYAMTAADRRVVGLYPELLRGIAREAGMGIELTVVPFARVALSLRSGEADITIGFPTDALQTAGVSLGKLMTLDTLVVASPARRVLAQREALAGWTVGRLRGGCQDLEQSGVGIRFFELGSFVSGLRMLKLERLDAVCGITREALGHSLQEAGVTAAELGAVLVTGSREAHVFVRHDLPEDLRTRLKAGLQRVRADGQLR